MSTILEITKITKIFKNGAGIKNFELKIQKGEIVGLLGDNGAGKSTFLKCLFRQYKADECDVNFLGEKNYKKYLKKISLFPEQSIYPSGISIYDFIFYSCQLNNVKRKKIKSRTIEILELLNLTEYKNKTFKFLSAGMQKRAMLALTLVAKPKVIFLDEPTANLDISSRMDFLEVFKKLSNNGISIIITSHIIDELEELIDRVVIIKNGEKVFDGVNNKQLKIKPLYKKINFDSNNLNIDKIISFVK